MHYKSLLAATGLLASGLAFAQPAHAGVPSAVEGATATCSMKIPAKLKIKAQYYNVPITANADCASLGMKSAHWEGTQPNDPVTEFIDFPDDDTGSTTATKLLLDDEVTPIGKVDWKGVGAHNTQGNPIGQANTSTWTKYGAWSNVVTSKTGPTVSVTGQIGYYNHRDNRYYRWPYKTGILQYAENGSKVWHNLSSFKTNSKGEYTVSYKPYVVRQYRLYVYETAAFWDELSKTVTR
jgi:hypothetical protein